MQYNLKRGGTACLLIITYCCRHLARESARSARPRTRRRRAGRFRNDIKVLHLGPRISFQGSLNLVNLLIL